MRTGTLTILLAQFCAVAGVFFLLCIAQGVAIFIFRKKRDIAVPLVKVMVLFILILIGLGLQVVFQIGLSDYSIGKFSFQVNVSLFVVAVFNCFVSGFQFHDCACGRTAFDFGRISRSCNRRSVCTQEACVGRVGNNRRLKEKLAERRERRRDATMCSKAVRNLRTNLCLVLRS